MKKNIDKQEVLLIVDNKKDIYELIKNISNIFKFISLIGVSNEEFKEVHKNVLENYGISLMHPVRIRQSLGNYDIIINSSKTQYFSLEDTKEQVIVFDFSDFKMFKNVDNKTIIYDIKLDVKDYNIKKNYWIDSIILSDLYEGLFKEDLKSYFKIVTENNNKITL